VEWKRGNGFDVFDVHLLYGNHNTRRISLSFKGASAGTYWTGRLSFVSTWAVVSCFTVFSKDQNARPKNVEWNTLTHVASICYVLLALGHLLWGRQSPLNLEYIAASPTTNPLPRTDRLDYHDVMLSCHLRDLKGAPPNIGIMATATWNPFQPSCRRPSASDTGSRRLSHILSLPRPSGTCLAPSCR